MVNTTSKPYKWRKFKEHLDSRETCDRYCKFYQYCPMTVPGTQQNCRLKNARPSDHRRFFNLYLMGERGLRDEFFETVFHVGQSINFETDIRNGMSYVELLQKMKKMYYDPKTKDEREEPPTFKVISSDGVSDEPLPMLPSDIAEQHDPDSLYNSELVQDLFEDD